MLNYLIIFSLLFEIIAFFGFIIYFLFSVKNPLFVLIFLICAVFNILIIFVFYKYYYKTLKRIMYAHDLMNQEKIEKNKIDNIIKIIMNNTHHNKAEKNPFTTRIQELENINKNLELNFKLKTKELQEKIKELERFHKLTIGRELKLIELKKRLNNNN